MSNVWEMKKRDGEDGQQWRLHVEQGVLRLHKNGELVKELKIVEQPWRIKAASGALDVDLLQFSVDATAVEAIRGCLGGNATLPGTPHAPPASWPRPGSQTGSSSRRRRELLVSPLAAWFWPLLLLVLGALSLFLLQFGLEASEHPLGGRLDLALRLVAGSYPCIGGGWLAMLYSIALMWKVLPRDIARCRPHEAVALLFVPIFGCYWVFQVFRGWARDFNRYLKEWPLAGGRASERLGLAVSLLSAASAVLCSAALASCLGRPADFHDWLPLAALGAAAASVVLQSIYVGHVIWLLNRLPRELAQEIEWRWKTNLEKSPRSIALGVTGVVLGALSLGAPLLLWLVVWMEDLPRASQSVLWGALPAFAVVAGTSASVLALWQRRLYHDGLSSAGLALGTSGAWLYGLAVLLRLLG